MNFIKYAQKVEQFTFEVVEANSEYAKQFGASFFDIFNSDLMALFNKGFTRF